MISCSADDSTCQYTFKQTVGVEIKTELKFLPKSLNPLVDKIVHSHFNPKILMIFQENVVFTEKKSLISASFMY
jgi:hypothetical protein